MILYILAYLGGILTIISPCILPVLPFVFARAGRPFLTNGLPMLIGMALFWNFRKQQANVADFCLAALSFTMASPIAWEHHYGILLPILAAIVPLTASSSLKPAY